MTRVKHLKSGGTYEVVGVAELQVSKPRLVRSHSGAWEGEVKCLVEGDHLIVYRGKDGRLWARGAAEFHDGRFEVMEE